ncbi:MAG: TerC family protein, partial [Hyphomicrobiales bacterium]|nr:TerC family protein [Hyphomicrobiales bacterium]
MSDFIAVDPGAFALRALEIVWINLLLSGDNAVVIAMACRGLPENLRRRGIWLGAGAAIGLRIVFAAMVMQLLALPGLKIAGALLLLLVAVGLLSEDDDPRHPVARPTLSGVVLAIVVADAAM